MREYTRDGLGLGQLQTWLAIHNPADVAGDRTPADFLWLAAQYRLSAKRWNAEPRRALLAMARSYVYRATARRLGWRDIN